MRWRERGVEYKGCECIFRVFTGEHLVTVIYRKLRADSGTLLSETIID